MSKFVRAINTFKNGLVSPRLRGAVVQAEDGSSCEVLENFVVDRTGAACKRPGMELLYKGGRPPSPLNGEYVFTTRLLGVEYVFSFQQYAYYSEKPEIFGTLDSTPALSNPLPIKTYGVASSFNVIPFQVAVSSWSYVGSLITLTVPVGHGKNVGNLINTSGLVSTTNPPNGTNWIVTAKTSTTIQFYATLTPTGAPTVSGALAFQVQEDMTMYSHKQGTALPEAMETGFSNHLAGMNGGITKIEKVSDRTILVLTNGSLIPYYISLLDYSDGNQTVRGFFKYPLFVSNVLLLESLGKKSSDVIRCPIVPSNYPFNPINTDPKLKINAIAIAGGQTGAAPVAGVITKSNDAFYYLVIVPKAMTIINGVTVSLEGRFLSIPSSIPTNDTVFFITQENSDTATTVTYKAIQVIGGVVPTDSTLWKLSSWGKGNYPRAGAMCFGRLILANTQLNPSQWWASALHPDNIQYYQGMMVSPLKQDISSDVSKINYAGVALGTITTPTTKTLIADIYRFGFSDFAPSYGDIQWITSRRRIHFGTSKGECQLTFGNSGYSAATYEQNKIGTTRSELGKFCQGNRRIFYVTNGTIRSISTDDKDYESVDTLISSTIEGLKLDIRRIEWNETSSCLMIHTYKYEDSANRDELYVLSLDNDTAVKAFSRVVPPTGMRLLSISEDRFVAWIDIVPPAFPSYYPIYYTAILSGNEGDDPNPFNVYQTTYGFDDRFYDFYKLMVNYGAYDNNVFNDFLNTDAFIYWKGVAYPYRVPVFPPDADELPCYDDTFDDDIQSQNFEFVVFTAKIMARMKTLPIFEGGKFGSSIGDIQRVDRVTILVDKSGPFMYGSEENNLMRTEGVNYGDTKVVVVDFPQSPDREQFVWITSDDISPLNISGLSLRGVSYSGE